jgi:DNA-binding ferritin-like protein
VDLAEFIIDSLVFRDQIHIFHLNVTNYPQHVATNEFYDTLLDEIDEIAEKFIAQGGSLVGKTDITLRADYNISDLTTDLRDYKQIVSKLAAEVDKSIEGELVEILQATDELLYKLRMT